jgi:hypothetical protein
VWIRWLCVLCVSGVWLNGCAKQQIKVKARTFPWSASAMARPKPVALALPSIDANDDLMPSVELDVPPPPGPLNPVHAVPARPRVSSGAGTPSDASRPEPLQIVPQLTPEETAEAQQQTRSSLSIAERNIGSMQGKTLNATQLDLASKVRSFVAEAREASSTGDWGRARNAAKKAEVLSEELVRSP